MKLALAIIAKDETYKIKNIISRYGRYFDEIAIAIDDQSCIDELSSISYPGSLKLLKYEWCDDFSHKRNWLAERIDSKYYLRIDTDDLIENPDKIVELKDRIDKTHPDVIYMKYLYAKDEDGNVIAEHWRESVIKKSSNHYWKKSIHENIFIEDNSIFKGARDSSIRIIHDTDPGHAEKSFNRNLKFLVEEYKKDGENTDPRTLAYLGRMLMGIGKWGEAICFLQKLVQKSGWNDDKYFAYSEIGFCHLQIGEYDQAIAACFEAMSINPDYPDAYICLGEIYINKKDYKKANSWLLHANSKKLPDTEYVVDPSRYTVRLAVNLAMSYFGMGEFEKAMVFFSKAESLAPSNQFIKDTKPLISDGYNQDKFIKNFMSLYSSISSDDSSKIINLIEAVPDKYLQDERIQMLRHRHIEPVKWGDKSVVIFCGQSWEEWAAPSVIKGIGGSEEAVIYLSQELVKKGYEVTVFNNCGDYEGIYGDVKYVPFYKFNPNDEYNIMIAWRGNIYKEVDFKAKKKYIWKHDVPSNDQYGKNDIKFDKIIVQSEYHKTLFPKHIPDDKFFICRNGINISDFVDYGLERNTKRMIYTSSYDRGIQHLLLRWKEVKDEIPEAELHLFYGWGLYDQMADKGFRDPSFKEKMVELMKQDGVYEHGRIGHKKLNKEFQRSGLWVYPCHFEEISCISAMKAQANGCVPVVVDYAALSETVKSGVKVKGCASDKEVVDEYIKALIDVLKDTDKQEELRKEVVLHKDEFSWSGVADEWDKEFNS